jgi:poly-gamma-glutamate capsule biosynthesis protein CapA/YwtB (metallophosphatase superfamily)
MLLMSAADAPAQDALSAVNSTILIGGDTHFGDNYFMHADGRSKSAAASGPLDYQKSLAHLEPLIAQSGFTFVNLETPLSGPLPGAPSDKTYVHWTDPDKAGETLAQTGIDAVGLANNHAYDQGEAGLRETLVELSRSKIAYAGAGLTLDQAQAPVLVDIALPQGGKRRLAIFAMFEERRAYRDQFDAYAGAAKPGVAPIDLARFAGQVKELRSQDPDVFVIAFPHWGRNYSWARKKQIRLGRALIDAGADMVIGQHGHNLQEIERYKGKWVLYGIGNFLFNAPGRYADHPDVIPFGLAVELRFDRGNATPPAVLLHPILSDNKVSGYQPRPATADEAAAILSTLIARPASKGLSATLVEKEPTGAIIELAE